MLALAGPGCSSEAPSETVEATEMAISAGRDLSQFEVNFYGLVALYHPSHGGGGGFAARPCSAAILNSTGGRSIVLTARHCVTTDGSTSGPLVAANTLRLSPKASPGAAGPPSDAVTPRAVFADAYYPDCFEYAQDSALIYVDADWSANVASRLGVWLGGPDRSGTAVDEAMGYGWNIVPDIWDCAANPSGEYGAGTARASMSFQRSAPYGFRCTSVLQWFYGFPEPNAANNRIMCGDSGGPDFVDMVFSEGYSVEHLLGVHSGMNLSVAYSAGIGLPIQQALGGMFLSPLKTGHTFNLSRAPSSHLVRLVSNSGGAGTTWIYNWATQHIYDPSQEDIDQDWCLELVPTTKRVTATLCSGASTQKWYLDPTLRIRSQSATGLCLTAPTGEVFLTVSTCADLPERQGWVFHPQP
jgi:hypothetical protein